MAGDGQQIGLERAHVDGEPADGLHGVGMERHPRCPRQARRLADRLHRPQLVVPVVDRGEGDAGSAHRRGEPVEVETAVTVGRDQLGRDAAGSQPPDRRGHDRVLDRARVPSTRRVCRDPTVVVVGVDYLTIRGPEVGDRADRT